jgi:succinate-acetate transporter protein
MSQQKVANPAPLGLIGFGMTTVLLNLFNSGLFDKNLFGVIFAVGLTNGGLAQIIAGIWELKNGNTFGAVAFTSYGFFWLSLIFVSVLPAIGWVAAYTSDAVKEFVLVPYLVLWGFFTLGMLFGTLKANRVLQFVFLTLTILFFLLAIGHYVHSVSAISWINNLAGFEGIVCGSSAIYLAIAEILGEVYGRHVLPIWTVKAKAAAKEKPKRK